MNIRTAAAGHAISSNLPFAKNVHGLDHILWVVRLDDARRKARVPLGRIAKGEDMLQQRRDDAQRATGTLKAVCQSYLQL
jgi:hypothetical protein